MVKKKHLPDKGMKNAGNIITLLKKEVKKFENPIITNIPEVSKTPFMVLVSCILSLRTKDTTTGPVAKALFSEAQTPQGLLDMPMKRFQAIIRPVNYYRTKSRHIKEICRFIAEENNSKVPDTFEGLMQLKGVGKKTAAITMVFGHKKPDYIPVDVHVHMISNRLGWVKTRNAEETMGALMNTLPKKYWMELNELFVLHGQNVCFTNSPLCSRCAISKLCPKIGVEKSR
jgi:endonuclease III